MCIRDRFRINLWIRRREGYYARLGFLIIESLRVDHWLERITGLPFFGLNRLAVIVCIKDQGPRGTGSLDFPVKHRGCVRDFKKAGVDALSLIHISEPTETP